MLLICAHKIHIFNFNAEEEIGNSNRICRVPKADTADTSRRSWSMVHPLPNIWARGWIHIENNTNLAVVLIFASMCDDWCSLHTITIYDHAPKTRQYNFPTSLQIQATVQQYSIITQALSEKYISRHRHLYLVPLHRSTNGMQFRQTLRPSFVDFFPTHAHTHRRGWWDRREKERRMVPSEQN